MESSGLQDEIKVKFATREATDDLLIAAAKSGNHLAFVELWARHSKIGFNMAYRITGNREDAEDVIQDAWLSAYVHLNTFDGRSKFSTWLTRVLPSIQRSGFYEGSVLVLRLLWRSRTVRPGSIGRL